MNRPDESTGAAPRLTLRAAQADATARLRAAGIDGPERDARALVGLALGVGPVELIADPDRKLDVPEEHRLAELIGRRLAREPVSRLRGSREFYGRSFTISPATLDPRPETETVVEAALRIVTDEGWRDRPLRILDVGTGSGALIVTLLAELPAACGLATDVSAAALAVAEANARELGVAERLTLRRVRSLDGLAPAYDLLVSNPPYIPRADIAGLAPEVVDYDPPEALDGGPDGLAVYREIAAGLTRVVPAGWALFEIGAGQSGDVAAILTAAVPGRPAAAAMRCWTDLGGHTRCVAISTQVQG